MVGEHDILAGDKLEPELVHEALESLYDNVALANSKLAQHAVDVYLLPDLVRRAQTLRNLLLDGIESLRPSRAVSLAAPGGRSYQVLSLRYVSGMQVEQVAERLSLGVRQVYRDLRRAEDDLLQMLAPRLGAADSDHTIQNGEMSTLVSGEMDALASVSEEVDLGEMLRHAIATVSPLAVARNVHISETPAGSPTKVVTTPGVLGQILVQTLSASIQSLESGQLPVWLTSDQDHAVIGIELPGCGSLAREDLLLAAAQLASPLGIAYEIGQIDDRSTMISLRLPLAQSHVVLIVEDNASVCELYARYLQGTGWRPTIVSNPTEALQTAVGSRPVAIIIDILMPEMEGWSVLQMLQVNPQTTDIPVVVCSVVNDPQLALALGAAACLKKPVSRQELLKTLERVQYPRSGA